MNSRRVSQIRLVESTRVKGGVLIYERFISDDGKAVHVYERYENSAAALAHLRAFGKEFGPRFVGMVDRKQFTAYGTPSEELKGMLDGFGATYLRRFGGFSLME